MMRETQYSEYEVPQKGRAGRAVFYSISIIVIIMLVLLLATIVMTKKTGEPPVVFGYSLFIVSSNSMQPAVPVASAIVVKETDMNDLKVNDIITFKEGYSNNNPVINTHRISQLNPTENGMTFVTKGDNNTMEDSKIRRPDEIIGKVVLIAPNFGKFLVFVKSPIGLITCIALPLFLLLVFEIINLMRVSKMPKEDFVPIEAENQAHMFGTHNQQLRGSKLNQKIPVSREDISLQQAVEYVPETQQPIITPKIQSTMYAQETPSQRKNQNYIPPLVDSEEDLSTNKRYISHTAESDDELLNRMNAFAVLRQNDKSRITTKAEEDAEELRVFNRYQSGEKEMAVMSSLDQGSFSATVQNYGKDRFLIDGIDVKVQPNAIQLGFEGDRRGREVSITVTKEYTNVIVESNHYEVNFALFKDEETNEEKVIIQEKEK